MSASDDIAFATICTWLAGRSGMRYTERKRELLLQRLARVQRLFGIDDLQDLVRQVEAGKRRDLELAVIDAASTNHTYFFREREVLDSFLEAALPSLSLRSDIRIWSAAASTGEEAYSLAMMIAEAKGLAFLDRVHILGTDISEAVVERAESGLYGQKQVESVPARLLDRYFRPVGIGQHQVIPEIKARCTFRRMNLMSRPYPFRNQFQAVLCRNVLYYFDQPDQVKAIESIADVTEPGGWLVTSVTERVRDLSTAWDTVTTGLARKAEP